MLFSFEAMFETILTIVWFISFSKISEKSMLFEYVDLAMSFKFAATNKKKWVYQTLNFCFFNENHDVVWATKKRDDKFERRCAILCSFD